MSVSVLFFASLREAIGQSSLVIELPAGVATVGQLRTQLASRGGDWAALGPGRAVRAAVNQDMVVPDHPLRDGDEIAFFPPVTGG
ncbi:molybdopterin converting factor subunit 1 [Niveibacterium umoris]|uniref:Molybdopterin synthase sulfur carrier subunit n=1 Tax=Niveibacterium umoris TaxID=1193620 RepID=A0A840BIM8_9RHOO|nr:molybdopterin converting factor subunit 1 [Niveibacterium umoris]MBB4011478.1 molybdopterin synthase sulfur carrier subunit [Niveibacterium umoris]